MKWKNDMKDRDQIKAILGEGTKFTGKLEFTGTVRIDGFFEGDVISDDILIIGINGVVKGNIRVGKAQVFGSIFGNIMGKNSIEVKSTAKIIGDLFAPVLSVEEGVKLKGNCNIGHEILQEHKSKQLLPVKDSQ
jgi:cytoskeletal protein CcmA (bactofilin family)